METGDYLDVVMFRRLENIGNTFLGVSFLLLFWVPLFFHSKWLVHGQQDTIMIASDHAIFLQQTINNL